MNKSHCVQFVAGVPGRVTPPVILVDQDTQLLPKKLHACAEEEGMRELFFAGLRNYLVENVLE